MAMATCEREGCANKCRFGWPRCTVHETRAEYEKRAALLLDRAAAAAREASTALAADGWHYENVQDVGYLLADWADQVRKGAMSDGDG